MCMLKMQVSPVQQVSLMWTRSLVHNVCVRGLYLGSLSAGVLCRQPTGLVAVHSIEYYIDLNFHIY